MTRFNSRAVLLIALVAAIIGGVATYGVSSLTGTAKTEVRITAQRLDDGRVEFALQQREDDGTWSDRLLPARRFFPRTGFVNRWANSTPLEIDSRIPFYINTTVPTRSVTVDEYIALCGSEGSLFTGANSAAADEFQRLLESGQADQTWGTLLTFWDAALSAAKSIAAPDELTEYHRSQIALLTLIAQYAYAQPSDAEFNPWELVGVALVAGGVSQQAEENLNPKLRQRLIDGGCIEADDGVSNE